MISSKKSSQKHDDEITALFQKDQIFEIKTKNQFFKFLKSLFSDEDIFGNEEKSNLRTNDEFFYRGINREETIIPTLLRLDFDKKTLLKKNIV